jgi:hypothetical protein
MPLVGQSTGHPVLLPFGSLGRSPGFAHRPDHDGRSPGLRHRSREPGLPVARPPLPSRRHVGHPTTVPPRPRRLVAQPPLPESGAPVCRLPGSVGPSTPFTLTRLPVPSPWRRRSSASGAVGVPRRRRPGDRPARHPRSPVGSVRSSHGGFSPRPEPLPPRGSGPFSDSSGPKALLVRLGLSTPVGVRSPVRRRASRTRNTRSRGIFESPGLSPELLRNPQDFYGRPPRVHSVVPNTCVGSHLDRRPGLTRPPRHG